MLRLIVPLLFFASTAWGQVYTVTPYMSTKALGSCVCKVNNDTVTAASSIFDSASVIGQHVWGVGVPEGTTVAEYIAGDTIRLSAAMTAGGSKTLAFSYFVTTTYGTGDWLGQIFRIYSYPGNSKTLVSVVLNDQQDILGNTDVVLFSAWSDTLGQDSAAVNIPAAQALKIVGIVTLSTAVDLGGGRSLQAKDIQIECPGVLYGRLEAKATMAPTTITPMKLLFGFK